MTAVVFTSPYQGLLPYGEADAQYFFGRDTDRRLVVANMESKPLTILYGPSGVGKTSFLHAAVLHDFREQARRRVEAGEAPELAALVFSSWRDEPAQALRAAVLRAVEEALGRHPESSPPDGFAETTSWAADSVHGSLYLILDQLEEYFLYSPSDGADRFGAELPRAVNSAAGRVSFLLSLREDALGQLDRFKGRLPDLFANYLRLGHLDREAGREAIERPLEVLSAAQPQVPGRVEPALVEAVLDSVDAGAEAIGVAGGSGRGRIEAPFLQLVLARVWEEELAGGSDVLRLETLQRLGGPEQLIEATLEGAMATFAPHERELASAVLEHLVTPSGARIALSAVDVAEFVRRPEAEIVSILEKLAAADCRILRATPGTHGETLYEVFSDLLVTPVREWQARFGTRRQLWPGVEEPRRGRDRVRFLERRVRLLVVVVGALTVLVVVLAVALLRGQG